MLRIGLIVVFASFLLLGENNILPFYNASPLTIVKQFTNANYIPTSRGSYDISLYRWGKKTLSSQEICLRSHSKSEAEPGIGSRSPGPQVYVLISRYHLLPHIDHSVCCFLDVDKPWILAV